MSKNLIIYYSRIGENYFGGEIKSIEQKLEMKIPQMFTDM